MPSQLQLFLLPVNFELDGMTSHKHGQAAKYRFQIAASEVEFWSSFETNSFRIAGTSGAETSLSGKNQRFLLLSEDKKSKRLSDLLLVKVNNESNVVSQCLQYHLNTKRF